MFLFAECRFRDDTRNKPDFHLASRAVFTVTDHEPSVMGFNDLPAEQEANTTSGLFGGIERNKEI